MSPDIIKLTEIEGETLAYQKMQDKPGDIIKDSRGRLYFIRKDGSFRKVTKEILERHGLELK